MTDEAFSHLASRDGFPKPRPPKRTGSARIFLPADYTAGMRREILHSLMSPIDLVVEIEKIQLT